MIEEVELFERPEGANDMNWRVYCFLLAQYLEFCFELREILRVAS
jgi:hypothetical protein